MRARDAWGRTAHHDRLIGRGLRALVSVSQSIHVVTSEVVEIVGSDRWCRLRHAVASRRVNAAEARCIADAVRDRRTRNHRDRWSRAPCRRHSKEEGCVREHPVRADDKLGFAGCRRSQTVEVGNQKSGSPSEIHALHTSRKAVDHLVPFEDVKAGRDECVGGCDRQSLGRRAEHVRGHVVTIGPYARVRVIDEISSISQEVVQVVLARCVRRRGNSDALVGIGGLPGCDSELRKHPTTRENVVRNNRVAVVM